ncbi:MAG: AAA-like domain-containing protein [Oculatellaceae cyanobacterium bins.114]|nr:AAA-like domain-containing protein [Oculatellaceae cyanobacterium bins.114]
MARSLKIRNGCIEQVKLAVKRNGFPSQTSFAIHLRRAKATVDKFLNGKPVDFWVFEEICSELHLNWQEIADLEASIHSGSVSEITVLEPTRLVEPLNQLHTPLLSRVPRETWKDVEGALYVDRPPIEADCYKAIAQPGMLIRIKAPRQMGKTSLIAKILHQATQLQYDSIHLSFQLADRAVFADLDRFLKWFCAVLSEELGLSNQVDSVWKDLLSCNYNTTAYLQNYLLPTLNHPLVLVLDNTDRVFEHAEIASDFCNLLRNWHDQAMRGARHSRVWQNLRLVIAHSTEVYSSLELNTSPLAGVGMIVELPDLNADQVLHLAQRYDLTWSHTEVDRLMSWVEGHPHLIQLAINAAKRQQVPLEELLKTAHTEAGIYSSSLRQLLTDLAQSPEMMTLFKTLVLTEQALELKSIQAFKLQSMGLIKLEGNLAQPRCLLYRKYFQQVFGN